MKGYINSIETMGLVDGPGVRYVVFLNGCNLRCIFCHNPETWNINKKEYTTPKKLMQDIKKYLPYYTNGGVTFSGGEPLIQNKFLLQCLKLCKKNKIHTAIDTSGVGNGNYKNILKYVDLVILDIKAIDEENYNKITGKNMKEFNKFLDCCQKLNKKLWLRQVIIPTINDKKEYIEKLNNYISNIKNVERVELLPYHTLGIEKYKKLNIPYKLKDIKDLSQKKLKMLKKYIKY